MRLAAAHAPRRVRVNAISPHAAATPMHYAIKRDEPEMYARANMTATWGRWSSADEQADVIVFLLGPRSTYVSGVNLVVDGGWWAAAQTTNGSASSDPVAVYASRNQRSALSASLARQTGGRSLRLVISSTAPGHRRRSAG
jgi:hypothetical protein